MPKTSRSKVTAITGAVIAVAACFPFVAQSVMPLTVYGAILLCPIGAITIAEHYILPRMGLTRYWSRYLGQPLNYAALIVWGISLAFAVAMVLTHAMSFYYIFLPEYLIALVLYPPIARMLGAKDSYPVDETRQAERDKLLVDFELNRLAESAEATVEELDPEQLHTARTAKMLLIGAGAILVFMVMGAVRLVYTSPDVLTMSVMKQDYFYTAIALTLAYFILALVAMRVSDGTDDSSDGAEKA